VTASGLGAAPATTDLSAAEVRAHPWCDPVGMPSDYRGPHELSRDGWVNFSRRLERREELSAIRATAAGHQRVLDIGGGTGELARAVAADLGRCTTVEPHRDRVAVLAADDGTSGTLEVHPGHAEALSLPDRSFDFVYAAWVLPYVDDVRASVREIARVCDPSAPNAVVAIIGGAPDNELVGLLNRVCVPLADEPADHQGLLLAVAAEELAGCGFPRFALQRTESALHFPEPAVTDRVTAASTILADFWYASHPQVAAMRRALEPALEEHFARRPFAVGDQGVVLVARPEGT